MRYVFAFSLALLALPALAEETPPPKLGPNAVPITLDHAYLTEAPAPDFWAFFPFVKPQFTSSACGVASITAAVTGLAGLPPNAEDTVIRQPELLEKVGDAHWSEISAEEGDGIKFDELSLYAGKAAEALGLKITIDSFHPGAPGAMPEPEALAELRARLAANEASADDVTMVYFNQGVVTGDWDGPHVSLVGAYDASRDRVLILEVDQEWYVPYWTPVPVLLTAITRPAPEDQGVLAGQTGGLVRLSR
ncbi:phytochelatin synthase [Rhodobacter sp. JA431]|uniref:phytochelatin synthase family protein n=1 Tax=Rhodobacter sp. JA431 TaxID=570013 RepID=UPI000BD95514|nr:phytochelatin synthase family protein [Rhodobacter sp. JA431]SOB91908.1 phytochelatin synthase [Rhodobacter sp. JA431]